jgi:hypothetical protein
MGVVPLVLLYFIKPFGEQIIVSNQSFVQICKQCIATLACSPNPHDDYHWQQKIPSI